MFAFGGVYSSTLLLPALACIILAIACRPALLENASAPRLDLRLFVLLGAAALQVIPLPRTVVAFLSPSAEAVARQLSLVDAGGALPLSIDLQSSAGALLLVAALCLLFFTARHIFNRGGVRTTTRMIAIIGIVVSGIALAQDATAHGMMYWRWRPPQEGPAPFGPFVNRNHFATWAMMAVPLCIGYLTAHASAHHGAHAAAWQRKVMTAIDARAWLLIASATLLVVATAASLSRSGLIGLMAALICGGLLVRLHPRDADATMLSSGLAPGSRSSGRRSSGKIAAFLIALGVLSLLAVLTQVGPAVIAGRFGASRGAMADRLLIWHDTLPVLRDFWRTGTGMGTFLTSMGVYQRSSPGVIFNQAHNHYLQAAAEGGLLVGVPAVLALWAFARTAWDSLTGDRSGMYWIRAGAAAGLCGVAIQSLWETGLTVPANAALAAVVAAILIHQPLRGSPRIH